MEPYFAAIYELGNIAFVMPMWAWVITILAIVIVCYRWGFGKAKKTHAKRIWEKYLGKWAASSGRAERAIASVAHVGSKFMVVDQLERQNEKDSNNETAPLELWNVLHQTSNDKFVAVPVPGYVPKKGEEVHLVRWLCDAFDKELPAVMYFIRPVDKSKQ